VSEAGAQLTAREREVLRLMADGLGNKGIATALGISSHTAKYHVASVLAKLDAHSRTEAVTRGLREGCCRLGMNRVAVGRRVCDVLEKAIR
jgi:DNA-binding NarL/FixJ family response regulator